MLQRPVTTARLRTAREYFVAEMGTRWRQRRLSVLGPQGRGKASRLLCRFAAGNRREHPKASFASGRDPRSQPRRRSQEPAAADYDGLTHLLTTHSLAMIWPPPASPTSCLLLPPLPTSPRPWRGTERPAVSTDWPPSPHPIETSISLTGRLVEGWIMRRLQRLSHNGKRATRSTIRGVLRAE